MMFLLLVFSLVSDSTFTPRILTNHVGYDVHGPKQALLQGPATLQPGTCTLYRENAHEPVASLMPEPLGRVADWPAWHFWHIDFAAVNEPGFYRLRCETNQGPVTSFPFELRENLLERRTLSDVLFYFKGQRSSGRYDRADRCLPFEGGFRKGCVDVHGGWYDATGDYGKHLSHLSFSTYFNPQQTPLVVWVLLETYRLLTERNDPNFHQYRIRALDEALYGADFLVRMRDPYGSFFRSVAAPGPEKRPEDRVIAATRAAYALADPSTRTKQEQVLAVNDSIALYDVSFRAGGGLAIAALARASTLPVHGDFDQATYLQTAEAAFAFLEQHNRQLTNDGRENILDDYSALLATTELYRATGNPHYREAANRRADRLMARLTTWASYRDYWRVDDTDRPFFHPSDAGLPVVSLLNYLTVADSSRRAAVLEVVRRALHFELMITREVVNPFGYARQLVQDTTGRRYSAFFFPHNTEAAPWWQGENARLASLAAAARMAAPYFAADTAFYQALQQYAWDQLHWILGRNPYDVCMLKGVGRNNPEYLFFNSYAYTNAPGGISNGITGGLEGPGGIAYNLGYAVTGQDTDWRWTEQWLPHAAWYLYAIALPHAPTS
ncbi:glycoside hydrolase family 9 protein [Rhodothermus marinus]|uniref:glycoside hydrolase family 9 protein n=1 Tax=Rhodothermus marinus TaxID=29549 RepID=UPI0037C77358